MSEQVPPPPERAKKILPPDFEVVESIEVDNPITFECNMCEEEVVTDLANTHYFLYENQPWFDHIRAVCEKGDISIMFRYDYMDTEQELEEFDKFANQFEKEEGKFAYDDPDLIKHRRETLGIEELQYKEIGTTALRYVENWGMFIQCIEITIEDFIGGGSG